MDAALSRGLWIIPPSFPRKRESRRASDANGESKTAASAIFQCAPPVIGESR